MLTASHRAAAGSGSNNDRALAGAEEDEQRRHADEGGVRNKGRLRLPNLTDLISSLYGRDAFHRWSGLVTRSESAKGEREKGPMRTPVVLCKAVGW